MDDKVYIQEIIPRQLPDGVTEEDVQREADTASNTLKVMFFLQLGFQFCLKGALSNLWTLFYALQIACYLSIYDIKQPANVEIYNDEIKKLIEFAFLNPEGITKELFDKDFALFDFIFGRNKYENAIGNELREPSMLRDLRWVILLVGAILILSFVVGIVGLFTKKKDKMKAWSKNLFDLFFFNGLIRLLSIYYIRIAMSSGKQVIEWLEGRGNLAKTDQKIAIFTLIFLFVFPVVVTYTIFHNKDNLDNP